jgi:ribosomal-protein-alanine N-acetyltransferase
MGEVKQQEKLSIRPATEDDLPAVLAIEKKAQPAPWNEGHFRSEMGKPYSRFWVMTDDETDSKVFGYIVFWVIGDECQILTLAVTEESRGRGIAKVIMRKAISESLREGAKVATLDVRTTNDPAVHLYQGLGFTVSKVLKAYYSNGQDAYQMTLPLEGERIEF